MLPSPGLTGTYMRVLVLDVNAEIPVPVNLADPRGAAYASQTWKI